MIDFDVMTSLPDDVINDKILFQEDSIEFSEQYKPNILFEHNPRTSDHIWHMFDHFDVITSSPDDIINEKKNFFLVPLGFSLNLILHSI